MAERGGGDGAGGGDWTQRWYTECKQAEGIGRFQECCVIAKTTCTTGESVQDSGTMMMYGAETWAVKTAQDRKLDVTCDLMD